MDNQILYALVQNFKEKGVSMHELLRDPLFTSLPLDKQIDVVQAYGGVLLHGSSMPSQSKVLSKAVVSGAAAGLFAGLPFMMKYTNPSTKGAIAIGSVLTGALAGGVSGKLMYSNDKDRFEKTNKYLIRLSKEQDTPAAIKVLDINRKHEPKTLQSIIKSRMSPESELINKAVGIAGQSKDVDEQFKKLEPK